MIRPRFEKFLRGLGIEQVAEKLTVSDRAVYHWLNGKIPQLQTAKRIVELARKHGYVLTLDDIRPGAPKELWTTRARRRRDRLVQRNKSAGRRGEDPEPEQKQLALAS